MVGDTRISTRRFALWTHEMMAWLKRQFDAVASSIDFTPVNNKLDTISNKIDNIPAPDMSMIAKQGTNPNANISDIQAKIGTPAQGQPSDLFAAIAAGGGGGITMMTDAEYQPALEDLATKLV